MGDVGCRNTLMLDKNREVSFVDIDTETYSVMHEASCISNILVVGLHG